MRFNVWLIPLERKAARRLYVDIYQTAGWTTIVQTGAMCGRISINPSWDLL